MKKTKYTPSESALLLRVGNNIRAHRKKIDISQEELADRSSTERSYMGSIERGEANATVLKLKKVADKLDVDVLDLFKKSK